MQIRNQTGLFGLDFLEFTTLDPETLISQWSHLGFKPAAAHHTEAVTIYQKEDTRLIINLANESHAARYAKHHGTCISALGFKVRDAQTALQYLRLKGAELYQPLDEKNIYELPAVYGVGNTLIYLVDDKHHYAKYFSDLPPHSSMPMQLIYSLYRGHLPQWLDFYTRLFGFHEIEKTELVSSCGKIRLSLNEAENDASPFLTTLKCEGIAQITFGNQSLNILDLHESKLKQHEVQVNIHTLEPVT
jgi:4-hydroxyphenylpyruvate dioxygenase